MAVLLPCHSHRHCTVHKYWHLPTGGIHKLSARSPSINSPVAQAALDDTKIPDKIAHTHSPKSSTSTLFQTIPNELLLAICVYLSSIDQASLALTCRRFANDIGPSAWKRHSVAGLASWYQHAQMLDLLERDFSDENLWRCEPCLRFHRRGKSALPKGPSRVIRLPHKVYPIMKGFNNSQIRFGPTKNSLYVIHFGSAKAVMDRHFLSESQGVCINTLKCGGTLKFPNSQTSEVVLRYSVTPKVIIDRLLVESDYLFTRQPTMFVQNVKLNEASANEFITHLDFWVCAHRKAGDILRLAERVGKKTSECKLQRCEYCPTQSTVFLIANDVIRVRSWQNFGTVRSMKETNWVHLSRIGIWKKTVDMSIAPVDDFDVVLGLDFLRKAKAFLMPCYDSVCIMEKGLACTVPATSND